MIQKLSRRQMRKLEIRGHKVAYMRYPVELPTLSVGVVRVAEITDKAGKTIKVVTLRDAVKL